MHHLISIVVPAYNAERFIGGCIESLLALDYPKEKLEITVVDNDSTDRTADIIRRYPVLCFKEPKRGRAAAWNKGAKPASGEIIASTDADCVVDSNWASEINRAFQDPRVDAVMGFTKGINKNFWACLEQGNFEEFWFRRTGEGYSLKRVGVDTRNCAIRKNVLEECGYLREDLQYCGDLDLSTKLRARKYRVAFNQEMQAWHHNRTDLDRILRIKEDHAREFLQIVQQQADGFDSPDLPSDFRTFLGLDNKSIHGLKLEGALVGLRVLRSLMIMGLRGFARFMSAPNGLAVKLFKTLCGISWEVAILSAKRQGSP
jgi:glycosyltransferase involved in cell wall biosynthesis